MTLLYIILDPSACNTELVLEALFPWKVLSFSDESQCELQSDGGFIGERVQDCSREMSIFLAKSLDYLFDCVGAETTSDREQRKASDVSAFWEFHVFESQIVEHELFVVA